MNINDYLIGHIRTLVPVWVAIAGTWLDGIGVDLDVDKATAVIVGVAISAYYVVVRALERKWPAAGGLLGRAKAPTYQPQGGPVQP